MPPPASTPADVVSGCVARFEASEPLVRAWTTFVPERALAQAAALHPRARAGMPLWGVPVGIKDVIDVAGMATTASSRVLAGNLADADAPVVARLRAAGAIVLGKTNTQEFAYGAVSAPTTNPLDPQRIPGGSSGGSAAALAAGHCWGALGTDTAGSIRIPAALCGVVGLKPRPGLLPRQGIIPLAPSFDVVGPMARTVAEVAVLWEVLSGVAVGLGDTGVADLWVAVAPLESLPELEPDVAGAYVDALTELGRLTRPLVRADIPAFEAFDGPRGRVLMSEALAVHRSRGWWPGRREDYTEETRGYLEFAEQFPGAALLSQARAECARLAGGLLALFQHVDALATPTVPCEAPTHAEAAFREEGRPRRPIVMKLTRIPGPVNVAGLAALSVPCGLTRAGLPVGLQLIGKDEAVLLRLGDAFERARG